MRSILLIAFIALVGNSAQAQGDWYSVNSNTTEHLYDIFFVDSLTGYCVGGQDSAGYPQGKIILQTTDGGENWTTIFSQDSLYIQSAFVGDSADHSKLYAFAQKKRNHRDYGEPYLVSTIVSSPPLNWSVTPISYRPFRPKVYNNAMYFADLSGSLKKLENDSISIVLNKGGLFDVNSNGLLWLGLDKNIPVAYFSNDYGSTIDTFNNLPPNWNSNQLTRAKMFLLEDAYLIYITYGNAIISSFDSGQTWNYVGTDNPSFRFHASYHPNFIFDARTVYAIRGDRDKITKTDYLGSKIDTLHTLNFRGIKITFINDRIGFVIGENGNILKTTNGGGGRVGINEGEELKKNIKVFPNPVKGLLRIEVPEGFVIEEMGLLNVEGREVKRFKKGVTVLEVSDIPAGPYVLRINTSEGVFTEKVVVE